MSFIGVELKFIETEAPAISRATRVDLDRVIAGHVLLWKACWSSKTALVTREDIAGAFGPERLDELIASMEAYTIEPDDEAPGKLWVVRGAKRYLRVSKARSESGKKRAAAAKRNGGKFTSKPPANAGDVTSIEPALTPSTEHRAPSTDISSATQTTLDEAIAAAMPKAPRPKVTTKPSESAHHATVAALCETFKAVTGSKYPFTGRDAKAVKNLCATGYDIPELKEAFERALRHVGYPATATLSEFATNLAHFAKPLRNLPPNQAGWSTTGAVKVTTKEMPE